MTGFVKCSSKNLRLLTTRRKHTIICAWFSPYHCVSFKGLVFSTRLFAKGVLSSDLWHNILPTRSKLAILFWLFYSTSLILARLSQNWMLTKHCKISNFFQDISGQYYGWPLPPKMQNIKMKQTKHNSGIVRVCEMKLMFKKWYLVVFLCGKVQSKRKWLMQLRNGLNTGVKIQRTIVERNSQS